ncbi:efflux RND transporter periplasmic adaptor subunit [Desulfosporosinus lacus]|uniref:RND family efflux transporter, MFP subunit n=1 Tax=Desulfosporosinus lacus DSM 15449 TaxID=1121420 RepID=A0A1M5S034_9FIRM|nr:efflux RND transporter periplasmic adaptor subunit [Desulfosporosinus lacus]SHH31751.1 RND family efflux transporter, MFP subunit [Desulfosporosinus lacus DSM 15449]
MEKKTWKKGKVRILIVALLAFGLLTGCSGSEPTAVVEEKYIPVEVEMVGNKALVNTAILSGKVSSETDVAVIPKVQGKVESVNVKVGDAVHAGEVLLTIDMTDLSNDYQLAEARYQNSKEQWESAKTSLERTKALASEKIADARLTLANTKALYDAGAASKSQLDQAELGLKELESSYAGQIEQLSVQASDSSLKLVEVQLTQARESLDNATVTAPVDGIVSQVNVTVGNTATSAQAALSLTSADSLYSTISVPENLVNRLNKNREVKVTVPSVSEKNFAGKIDNISPSADPKTQLYPLKVLIENMDGLIKPGMFAKVELVTDEKADVMAIKSEAVVLKNEKTIVWIVQEDKAVAKEVVTGLDTGVDIEILEGLNQGDTVIVKGQTLVDEGHKVKIVGGEES